jgi:ribosomal protein S18 acetylase RimI-like enzyme
MSAAVKITLRTYSSADFETLYKIDQACYPADTAYSRSDMRAYLGLAGAECVVAEVGEDGPSAQERKRAESGGTPKKIAGFCISARRNKDGYIVTMDVLEEYRRLGIATALLAEIEKRLAANGVVRVGLETATDNHAGVAFWQKHGYRTRGVRKGYYPGRRDAHAMTKNLRAPK